MAQPIPEHFRLDATPIADPAAVVSGPNVRFTVLADRVIRLEDSPSGQFEDRPSQPFWYREQPLPNFAQATTANTITIETDFLQLSYTPDASGFTAESLSITLKETGVTWHYGDANPTNLGGTMRTLDEVKGAVELEQGLLSRAGWTLVDDSETLVFDDAGWIVQRGNAPGQLDLYFFGYGQDFAACIADYCKLTGPVPLLPRWVLGNWWSRYYQYTDQSLLTLMDDFKAHEVPLSVCIVDMDWHITDTGNASSGWTGYTWNTDFFPNPTGFIGELHERGLKTALNLHPAAGIHNHEAAYEALGDRLGFDTTNGDPIDFNIPDSDFANAYLELLHHPEEERGVDFWWMDWQQGELSTMPGLDPLWWLNHVHYLDLGREGKRSFIFSRWGGLGNHRYPIGFSGDTVVDWDSLRFQPYFTSTAANVGYSWWSHDIGGHMEGVEDAELYARWVQYGVFSPIMRLHSTNNPFHDRRPFGYDAETFHVTRDAMQLRHAMITYLYSMSWQNSISHQAFIQPMYHQHPNNEAAYHCPQQYTFGKDLIAAPFTVPADPDTRLSRQVVWLPEGDWYQFFSGEHYTGDSWQAVYGDLRTIPVFARAGAIIPLGPKVGWGGIDNPDSLDLHIFTGADGAFTLFEDDGESRAHENGAYALTEFTQKWQDDSLVFDAVISGDTSTVPAKRAYTLHFNGITAPQTVLVMVNGKTVSADIRYDSGKETFVISGVTLTPQDALSITLSGFDAAHRDRTLEHIESMLHSFKLQSNAKWELYKALQELPTKPEHLNTVITALADSQLQALIEVLYQVGVDYIPDTDYADRCVVWNNREDPRFAHEFSLHYGPFYHGEEGIAPRFKVILPEEIVTRFGYGRNPSWRLNAHFKHWPVADITSRSS